MMKSVHCNKCDWCHFQVSAEYVREWEAQWLKYFNEKDAEWLGSYGITDKPPSTEEYTNCFKCGGSYKDFRDSTPEDLAKLGYGHTIGPILNREEDL